MKKISYFNKKLKGNVDYSKELKDEDYEIVEVAIEIEDKDLDYYLDIINKSYGEFGKITTEEGQAAQPNENDQLKQRVADLQNYILEKEANNTTNNL